MTKKLRDLSTTEKQVLGAAIGLSKACKGECYPDETLLVIARAVAYPREESEAQLCLLREKKRELSPNCATCAYPCGRTADYDFNQFLSDDEETKQAKEELYLALQEIAKRCLNGEIRPYAEFLIQSLGYLDFAYSPDNIAPILSDYKKICR